MKRMLVAFLTICTLLSFSSPAFAYSSDVSFVSNDSIEGIQASSIDELFSPTSQNTESVIFNGVNLYLLNNKLYLSGYLSIYGENIKQITTSGTVYRFRSDGGKDTYLVDFDDCSGIHFVQAKLSQNEGSDFLSLIIQSSGTEDLISFDIPIPPSSDIKNEIIQAAITTENDTAFSLYSIAQNILSVDTSTMTASADSDGGASISVLKNGSILPQGRASYNTTVDDDEWNDFFAALHNDGTANLNDFEIDERILNTGWVFLNNSSASTGKYSLACYTSQNGSYEKLLQFSFIGIVHQSTSPLYASLQMTINEGMILSYNEVTEDFDILYYNWGTTIDELSLALTVPGGASSHTVFVSRRLECNLPDNPSTLESVIALIPYLNTAYDVWNILATNGEPTSLNFTQTYEDSYQAQYDEYDGKVRRVIAGTTGSNELDRIGHSFLIRGDLFDGYSGCSSWKYEYTASHNL